MYQTNEIYSARCSRMNRSESYNPKITDEKLILLLAMHIHAYDWVKIYVYTHQFFFSSNIAIFVVVQRVCTHTLIASVECEARARAIRMKPMKIAKAFISTIGENLMHALISRRKMHQVPAMQCVFTFPLVTFLHFITAFFHSSFSYSSRCVFVCVSHTLTHVVR